MINVNWKVFRFVRAKFRTTIRFTRVILFGVPSTLSKNMLLFPNSIWGSWNFFVESIRFAFFNHSQKKKKKDVTSDLVQFKHRFYFVGHKMSMAFGTIFISMKTRAFGILFTGRISVNVRWTNKMCITYYVCRWKGEWYIFHMDKEKQQL